MVVLRLTFDDRQEFTCPMSRWWAEVWCVEFVIGGQWQGQTVRRAKIVALD